MSFEQASAAVVDWLARTIPLGSWSVSRRSAGRQVYLELADSAYGRARGGSHAWDESFCQYVTRGETPRIAPDISAVPQYATAREAQGIDVAAYAGVPIRGADGAVFGTLCGMDPAVRPDLVEHGPVLELFADLLGHILASDQLRDEARLREAELTRAASTDPLTGLPNRVRLLERASHALDLHRRTGHPVGLLAVDLDGFKAVNDTHGHQAGDELLMALAERLQAVLRPGDTLARLAGDEFAVLVEDGGDEAAVARRVVEQTARPFPVSPPTGRTMAGPRVAATVRIGASVGIARLRRDSPPTTVADLLAAADAAMYDAKRAGGSRVHDASGRAATAGPGTPAAAAAVPRAGLAGPAAA